MSLKDIKGKIQSIGRTRKVTKAMEAVSAVKMRKTQTRALSGRPYAKAAFTVLRQLSASLKTSAHPLTTARPVSRATLIVVTSDKGLCGTLNAAVLKEAERLLSELALPVTQVSVYAFGKKAAEYFERRSYALAGRYENVRDDVTASEVQALAEEVSRNFENSQTDTVYILYTNFKSTFEQKPVTHRLLPLNIEDLSRLVEGIYVRNEVRAVEEATPAPAFYTSESDSVELLSVLLPKLVGVSIYHALIESKASEHSARMVAMKNASDKSKDLSKLLTRKFNKARQAMITREVSEIVGGIEAMAGS